MNQSYQSVLAAGVEKKYRALEEEIMRDVVRRITKTKKITSAADWQLQRYMILGNSTEDVEDIIRTALDGNEDDVADAYRRVIESEYVRSKEMYEQVNAEFVPYEQNYELQQLTDALIRQSNDELFNISKSLGFMVDMGNGRTVFSPLSEVYNGYLDNAIVMMASGAFDYNTLIRKVVKQMTASGLRTVDYVSGRSNRVDVAARRALLTGMGQLTGRISDMNGEKLGTDKFEVDRHPGARPDHAVWQGRVWTRKQLEEVCGLGTGPGLLGWNCRHTYYPFIEGVSVRNYSDAELAELDWKEAQKVMFRGRGYNAYEATQKQRYMETAMRAQREKVKLLQQGGADSDEIMLARCKYQAMLDEYKEFSKKMKLPEQRERIYYDLRGRVAPSKKTYQNWKAEQSDKAAKKTAAKERKAEREMKERQEKARREDLDKNVEKAYNSGIIASGAISGARNPFGEAANKHAERYYGLVRSMTTDVGKIARTTGYSEDEIQRVKDYIFTEEHDLGEGLVKRFDPDYMMGESWRRLMEGTPEHHDLVMIEHEILERKLIGQGMSQDEAHVRASKQYNYGEEALKYYGQIKKYRKE